jgi:hypothetical protein
MEQKSEQARQLCARYQSNPFKQLIFFDLRAAHWLVFHHDLHQNTPPACTAYNSLSSTSLLVDIDDQLQVHYYLKDGIFPKVYFPVAVGVTLTHKYQASETPKL